MIELVNILNQEMKTVNCYIDLEWRKRQKKSLKRLNKILWERYYDKYEKMIKDAMV